MPRARLPPKSAPRPAVVDRARDAAIAEIERQQHDDGDATALLDKARLLLTRHWAKADWAARAKLIESADWLIKVAASPKGARAGKAR